MNLTESKKKPIFSGLNFDMVNIGQIVFLVFLLLFTSLSCSENIPLEEKLQKILDKGISRYGVKGVSAAVILPDQKVWTGVSGISYDTVALSPDMPFGIGSVTKNFVAALTLKLVEDGVLSLDEPISNWLPEYPNVDGNATIRQLLNHTSGIYMFWQHEDIWADMERDKSRVWTPEEVLGYVNEPYFAPGQGSRYSNTNYLLMAMIITKATGSSLSAQMRERLWLPLDIGSARMVLEEGFPQNQAHVYWSGQDITFEPRMAHECIGYGSSGLFMTAQDLARWSHALFTGKVLKHESMEAMQQFVDIDINRDTKAYGLGVQLFAGRMSSGETSVGHTGGGHRHHHIYGAPAGARHQRGGDGQRLSQQMHGVRCQGPDKKGVEGIWIDGNRSLYPIFPLRIDGDQLCHHRRVHIFLDQEEETEEDVRLKRKSTLLRVKHGTAEGWFFTAVSGWKSVIHIKMPYTDYVLKTRNVVVARSGELAFSIVASKVVFPVQIFSARWIGLRGFSPP
ncbi:serine hydrolase domain-containing protein [Gemmatimonadota bacterium]